MDNSKALAILTILKALEAFLVDIAPRGIEISRNQCGVYIRGLDRSRMAEVKALGARFLKNHSPERTAKHARVGKRNLWMDTSCYLVCGIELERTRAEQLSIVIGPVKGVNY